MILLLQYIKTTLYILLINLHNLYSKYDKYYLQLFYRLLRFKLCCKCLNYKFQNTHRFGKTNNSMFSFIHLGTVPLKLKIVGEDIYPVQEIEKRTKELTLRYMHIKSVQEGSIIICLDVPSSALHSLGYFFEDIETLLSTVLRRQHNSYNGSTSNVIISLEFMDQKNGKFCLQFM